jgi:1,4-dihydroxy-2-naphthoate octaprenyltransferase
MSRPDQLLLMAIVYGAGLAVGVVRGAVVDPTVALAGYLAFLPLAASVHYANEYADYGTDRLAERTPFSGGSGALARTGLPRSLALRAAVASLAVGTVATAVAWDAGVVGVEAVALLAAIVTLGWGYSLPPLALAWRGVGEIDNAFLGGIALPTYGVAVATGRVALDAAVVFVPFGFVVFVNLLATTWPDRVPDATVGKATLATRLGPGTLRGLYAAGTLAAAASLAALHGDVPAVVCYAEAAALLLLAPAAVRYTRQHSPFPTVAAMVTFATVQFAAWGGVATGVLGG